MACVPFLFLRIHAQSMKKMQVKNKTHCIILNTANSF